MTGPARPEGPSSRLVLELALVAALALASALVYDTMFGRRSYLLPLVVVAVASTGLAGALRHRSLGAMTLLSVAAFLLVVAAVGAPPEIAVPTPVGLIEAAEALVDSWGRLRATALPVDPGRVELALPLALTWAAALGGASAVTRTRLTTLSLAPPLAALAVAAAIAAPAAPRWQVLLPITLLLGLALSALASRSSLRVSATGMRLNWSWAGASTAVALVVGLGVTSLADGALGARQAFRDPQAAGDFALDGRSPLAAVKSLLVDTPDLALFDVEGPVPERVRWATFDRYDGVSWSVDAAFQRTGSRLPVAAALAPRGESYRVVVRGLDGRWLPVIVEASAIDAPEFRFEPGTGNALLVEGLRPDLAYGVAAADDAPGALTAEETSRYLQLPSEMDEVLATAAAAFAGSAGTAGTNAMAQLEAIEAALSGSFAYSAASPSGHSERRLTELLSTDHRGNAEQFASAFTIMARTLGYPSRVVVGFETTSEAASRAATTVLGEDVHVWSEVHLGSAGWVVFDPTPPRSQIEPSVVPAPPPMPASGGGVADEQPAPEARVERGAVESAVQGRSGVVTGLFVVGPMVVVPLGAALVVAVAKRQRRHRRRSAPVAADRVIGAWSEVKDRLVEAKAPTSPALTPVELAATSGGVAGETGRNALERLAPAVNEAIYEPASTTEDAADRAWDELATFTSALHANQNAGRRLANLIDPRPLVGRR